MYKFSDNLELASDKNDNFPCNQELANDECTYFHTIWNWLMITDDKNKTFISFWN